MSASVRVTLCGGCSRAWWRCASRPGLVGGEAFSVDASLIKADVDKKKRMPGDQPITWPKAEEASHAVREYLAALDTARDDEVHSDRDGNGSSSDGKSKPPKEVSLTDPQATWVARPGMDPFFAYDANYLIDNKVGIILDAEGTRTNRTVEIAITQTMVERVGRRFDLRPQRLAGDTAYGAVRLLKWLVDRKITPHIPVWDKSKRQDGTFNRADFVFDRERNIYVCPAGAELTSTGNIDQGRIVYYRASKNDCSICALKPKCTTAVAAQDHTRRQRGCRVTSVRALANTKPSASHPRAQENRDAIRAHEAHPQARSPSTARLERRQGRGAAHRNRAEPEAARQVAQPCPTIVRSCLPSLGVRQAWVPQLPQRKNGHALTTSPAAKRNRVLQQNLPDSGPNIRHLVRSAKCQEQTMHRPSLLLWLDLCPQCKDLCNNALVCNRAQSSFDVIHISDTQF